ncbi:MAG: C40 family peptidase [Burkholderiaceae bacterium]|nr:C40 family peptidase [Burkholderiaceae bacterium]
MPRSRPVAVACFVAVLFAAGLGTGSPARATQLADKQAAEPAGAGRQLVLHSLSLIGVRYRFGGTSPDTGLDCSGLVQHVFDQALGFALPRRAEEMSRTGTAVARDALQPGDLVFFNTLRRAFSHVGIYIGENRFVHAPSAGGRVRVESIGSRYWARRFNGARRVATPDPAAEPAAEPTAPAPTLLETRYTP